MTEPVLTTTRWYLYVFGSLTVATDEDLSITDEEITEDAMWRLVAAGTEEACEAAARLWKS